MSANQPSVSTGAELYRGFFVFAVFGAFTAVWWPGFYEFDRLLAGVLLAALVLLGTRFAGRSGLLLSFGMLGCLVLILKDFWPNPLPWTKDWVLMTELVTEKSFADA